MANNYKPKKIVLSYEKFEEVIENALDGFDYKIGELYNYSLHLSKLNSMLMNLLTVTNKLLQDKKIFTEKEYNIELNKLIAETKILTELAAKDSRETQLEYNDIIYDTYDDTIFDNYNDSEIAHC